MLLFNKGLTLGSAFIARKLIKSNDLENPQSAYIFDVRFL